MGLKDRLRRLEREAEEDGIVIRLQDGTVRVFDPTVVAALVAHPYEHSAGTADDGA